MSESWPQVRLGDVSTIVMGQSPPGEDCNRKAIGQPLLNGPTEFGARYPTPAQWTTSPTKWAEPGDVLFCVRGSTTGRMNRADAPYVIGRGVAAIRGSDGANTDFLHYSVVHGLDRLLANATGSTFPNLGRQTLAQFSIAWPDQEQRTRIAGVLGALDDLIEVNRGLITDLDATLAASWSMVARATVTTKTFGEVADASKGLSYKGAFLAERGLPMINMGSFGANGKYRESGLKWYVESEVKPKSRLVKGDLVIVNTDLTQSRDILARPIVVPYEHATSTHHTYQVRVPGGEAQRFWLYCALREESVRQRLISYATGTTVAALPKDALISQDIPWADDASISSWWLDAEPLYSSQLALHDEIKELARTRDELLPLLMSGRVRVGDVAA